jgi:hypothetical protein
MTQDQLASYVSVARREADEWAEFYADPLKFDPDYYVDPDFPDDPHASFGITLAENVLSPDLFDFFDAGDDLDSVARQVIEAIADSPLFAATGSLQTAISDCQHHLWHRAAAAREASNFR